MGGSNMVRMAGVILLIISASMCQWYVPKLIGAYGEYSSALVGGEATSGVALEFAKTVEIGASLWTYQSTVGWQTWGGTLRSDVRISPCTVWRISGLLGVYADMVNLTGRNPSPALSGIQKISRYYPTFAIGAGVDSVKFICKDCKYYFTGEALVGDFIAFGYRFDDASVRGESLSTTFVISAETATPYGAAGAFRKASLRKWSGDNIWRLYYTSPYCCGGLLRGTVGWESDFIGFAAGEINIEPFTEKYPLSVIIGAKLPRDISLWQWNVGLQFHPQSEARRKCKNGISTNRDVEILAPTIIYPY